MPLKALLEDNAVIAPVMDEYQWQQLRNDLRVGKVQMTLPCCGARCFARESKLGTRHFYHQRSAECGFRGETLEHLIAKEQVLAGGIQAGWEMDVEVAGDGWRADVLAQRDSTQVAFEVQWSSQTLAKTQERQTRYAEAGVRCAWLFRRIPKGAIPSHTMPMFELDFEDRSHPTVNGHRLPEHAKAMLSGQYRFCPRVVAASEQVLDLEVFDYQCWKCKCNCNVYRVSNKSQSLLSPHGDSIAAYLHEGLDGAPEFCTEALGYIERLTGDSRWRRLRIGAIKKRYSRTAECSYLSQGCPNCDALFGEHHLGIDLLEKTPIHEHKLVAKLVAPVVVDQPHWCYSAMKSFCGQPAPQK